MTCRRSCGRMDSRPTLCMEARHKTVGSECLSNLGKASCGYLFAQMCLVEASTYPLYLMWWCMKWALSKTTCTALAGQRGAKMGKDTRSSFLNTGRRSRSLRWNSSKCLKPLDRMCHRTCDALQRRLSVAGEKRSGVNRAAGVDECACDILSK